MAEMRLIDANSLREKIKEVSKDAGFYRPIYEGFLNAIEHAPTVDAVEVVRCKGCKHWNELKGKDSGKPVGYGDCRNGCGINGIAYEDSFCSYGERKSNVES